MTGMLPEGYHNVNCSLKIRLILDLQPLPKGSIFAGMPESLSPGFRIISLWVQPFKIRHAGTFT